MADTMWSSRTVFDGGVILSRLVVIGFGFCLHYWTLLLYRILYWDKMVKKKLIAVWIEGRNGGGGFSLFWPPGVSEQAENITSHTPPTSTLSIPIEFCLCPADRSKTDIQTPVGSVVGLHQSRTSSGFLTVPLSSPASLQLCVCCLVLSR